MSDITRFLFHAGTYVLLTSLTLLAPMVYNPRLMMQDYPPPIKALVPPKSPREKRLALLEIPFMLVLLFYPIYAAFDLQGMANGELGFLHLFLISFCIAFAFNLWDWLILDWLLFCTLTPRFIVLPGTEGHPAYRDYAFHFRGFLIGTGFCLLVGLITAALVSLLT